LLTTKTWDRLKSWDINWVEIGDQQTRNDGLMMVINIKPLISIDDFQHLTLMMVSLIINKSLMSFPFKYLTLFNPPDSVNPDFPACHVKHLPMFNLITAFFWDLPILYMGFASLHLLLSKHFGTWI
jgi:hypothetical protein